MQAGDLAGGFADTDAILDLDAANVDAWMLRGNILLRQQAWADGLAAFDYVLEQRPEDFAAWNAKSTCLLRLGRLDEARACAHWALQLHPQYAVAARTLAEIDAVQGAASSPATSVPGSGDPENEDDEDVEWG